MITNMQTKPEIMKKACKDCSRQYDGTRNSRFCPQCRQRRARAGQARKREEIKETLSFRKALKPEHNKIAKRIYCNTVQCRKCLYKLYLSDSEICCGYLYYTGKMRPSEPSPECRAFEKMNKKKRAKLLERVNTPPSPVPARSRQERQYAEYAAGVIAREERRAKNHKRGR